MTDQKLIVFVGPDMCGKTEISTAVANDLGIPYFKAGSENEKWRNNEDFINEIRFADERMVDILKQTGYSLVLDRAWPCEYAYSQVFERNTDLGAIRITDNEFAKMNAKIICCYRSNYDNVDLSHFEHRFLSPRLLKDLEIVYRRYAAHNSQCEWYFLNVDDEDLDREVLEVMAFLRGQIN